MSYKIKLPVSYSVCIILLGILSFTKIYRNSIGYSDIGVGGIWNIITLVFFCTGAIALITIRSLRSFPKVIRLTVWYSAIAFINAIINIKNVNISTIYNYIMIGYFSMILCTFFAASKNGITKKGDKLTWIVFAAVSVMAFISVFRFRAGSLAFSMVSNAYYSLCLMPFLPLLTKKKWLIVVGYSIVGVIVVFSGKRLGLIAYVAYLLIVVFYDAIKSKRVFSLLKTLCVILISYLVFMAVYSKLQNAYGLNILERITTLSEDGGSGRDNIYRQIWQGMRESSFTEWIFGHGYGTTGTVMLRHDTAHNDFLEILFDFGIFPALIFVVFYLRLLSDSLKMLKRKYKYAGVFLGAVIMSLLLSLFSTYCVSYAYVTCGMAVIGVIYGLNSICDKERGSQ